MNFIILFYILFYITVLLYCIISEIRSQDCITECENQAPNYKEGENIHELIAEGTRTLYETVFWRRAFIIALLVIGLILFIYWLQFSNFQTSNGSRLKDQRKQIVKSKGSKDIYFPRGIDLSIAILFIFLVVYFIFMFIEENFWKPIGIQIRNVSQLL